MNTYSTRDEAIQNEIITPLGQYANEHNIDAIADEIILQDNLGNGEVCYFNALEDEPDNFWDVVANNAK